MSKPYHRIRRALADTPWAIVPEALDVLIEVVAARVEDREPTAEEKAAALQVMAGHALLLDRHPVLVDVVLVWRVAEQGKRDTLSPLIRAHDWASIEFAVLLGTSTGILLQDGEVSEGAKSYVRARVREVLGNP